ncbi:MAG: hypothetical protein U0228_13120 [Myxococcaceae bacterium]
MLATALTLTVVLTGAPPARGFLAPHTPEVVTQVETRLPQWLNGGGDWNALLATPAELKTYFVSTGVKAAATAPLVEQAVKNQAGAPELKDFTATRALVEFVGKRAELHLYDASGHVCEVTLLAVGTVESQQRYVVLSAIRTATRGFDEDAKALKDRKEMLVYVEKTNGQWNTGSMPSPPPPDCTSTITAALKTLFAAEKSYLQAHDAYTNSIGKLGVDLRPLGISSAKISVAGNAPQQTFSIQVGAGAGVMKMDEKGEVTTIVPCAAP